MFHLELSLVENFCNANCRSSESRPALRRQMDFAKAQDGRRMATGGAATMTQFNNGIEVSFGGKLRARRSIPRASPKQIEMVGMQAPAFVATIESAR
jgi:hypothetical protein